MPKKSILFAILLFMALLSITYMSKAKAVLIDNKLTTKEPVDPYKDQINLLQKELQRTDLSDETRKIEEGKLITIIMMATQRADGKRNRPTRGAGAQATPTILVAGMKLPDGIDNHPSVPFSESIVKVLNSWRKTTSEHSYLVFAGYLSQDPEQGALLVFHPDTHIFQRYLTPQREGGVSVIAEEDILITLESRKGTVFYFDVAKEQFVNLEGTPIPTIVPSPSVTPTLFPGTERTPTPIMPYP